MTVPAISAILLSWKRRHNLPAILESLQRSPYIKEMFVWNNDPDVVLQLPSAVVVNASKNFFCLPRYSLVPLAGHETIWMQDDDLLISPEQLESLVAAYRKDSSRIYGCRGRNIVGGRYSTETVIGECDIILGQSMLFHRSLVGRFFGLLDRLPPITVEDDIAFSLACGCRHMAVDVGRVTDLGWDDETALWRRADHFEKRQRMIDAILRLRSCMPPA